MNVRVRLPSFPRTQSRTTPHMAATQTLRTTRTRGPPEKS
jgi:hypothetical protein